MSALDLFASALGAFIMIAVILFPSYLAEQRLSAELEAVNAVREELETGLDQAKQELEEKGDELDDANNALAQAAILKAEMDEEVEALRLEIARTFLIISIEWDTPGVDVDLGIRDPARNYYFFGKTNKNGTDFPPPAREDGEDDAVEHTSWAELSFDNRTGPGLELWQAPLAAPGIYEITYTLFSSRGPGSAGVPVRGKVYYRNGRKELPEEVLDDGRREVTIRLRVTEEGTLEFP